MTFAPVSITTGHMYRGAANRPFYATKGAIGDKLTQGGFSDVHVYERGDATWKPEFKDLVDTYSGADTFIEGIWTGASGPFPAQQIPDWFFAVRDDGPATSGPPPPTQTPPGKTPRLPVAAPPGANPHCAAGLFAQYYSDGTYDCLPNGTLVKPDGTIVKPGTTTPVKPPGSTPQTPPGPERTKTILAVAGVVAFVGVAGAVLYFALRKSPSVVTNPTKKQRAKARRKNKK